MEKTECPMHNLKLQLSAHDASLRQLRKLARKWWCVYDSLAGVTVYHTGHLPKLGKSFPHEPSILVSSAPGRNASGSLEKPFYNEME